MVVDLVTILVVIVGCFAGAKLGIRLAYYNPGDEQWAKEMREFVKQEKLRKK